ncbi:unnamed protein product [Caenorhabditis angaria]|uniref:SAC domain-containing protein n=1 Tax=Caenorhabditis angaria TaxID=860376 RepID=A0A9P1MT54_9PELO|nr:unnamed protein product [Caenorhabditis angaria]
MPSINVLNVMEDLAMKSILKNGWFQTCEIPEALKIRHRDSLNNLEIRRKNGFIIQHGICRTNCVDCLDRTNVAQFVIAKVALGCQLCAFGILDEPNLNLQGEVCRLLEDMFDEHGDTMALQYAGSQLVHSIKHYKKTAAFQERRRDVFQTLSRYYSNTFGDYDKQTAINLFLGVFKPKISSQKHLWELTSDYFLHFPYNLKIQTDYCAWILSEKELENIVFLESEDEDGEFYKVEWKDVEQETRRPSDSDQYRTLKSSSTDEFRDYYRTYEFTPLDDRVGRLLSIENRAIHIDGINQEPTTHAQFLKLWKTSETKETKTSSKPTNKESDDEDDEEEIITSTQWSDVVDAQKEWYDTVNRHGNVLPNRSQNLPRKDKSESKKNSLLSTGLKFAKDIYKLDHLKTTAEERKYYEKYSKLAWKCDKNDWEQFKPTLLESKQNEQKRRATFFTADDCFRTENPEVSKASRKFYEKSVDPLLMNISKHDMNTFAKYVPMGS